MARTSYETRRTSPYSEDLRWRMIWQREVKGLQVTKVATNLGVDPSTVSRIVAQFRCLGVVHKKRHPSNKVCTKLTETIKVCILHLVLNRPGIYLHEIRRDLLANTGADVSLSSICKFLKKMRFTRQKLKVVAQQRDFFLRSLFVSEVSIYEPPMLIFLDETGSDSIRKYGYSIRGKSLVSEKLLVRGKRVSAIAFMSVYGMLDCKTVTSTVNGEGFYNFVETALLPHLMPFNGTNPHSVVVMGNCAIHHVHGIVEMIHEVGALVHFLPPYSPNYNPIEEAFSKVKCTLKLLDQEAEAVDNYETIVLSAFSTITPHDCQQWIDNAGIYKSQCN